MLLGWTAHRDLRPIRWLSLTTGTSAVALPYAQVTRRAPALPVALSVIVTGLGGVTVIGLLRRVLAGRPQTRPRAGFGLLAALTITGGGYASMRQEGGTDPGELETITLEP